MKIAVVSLNQSWEDKSANKERCRLFIERAANDGSELIIFPEMTLTGFSMNIKVISENLDDSDTLNYFKRKAKENNINIIFGYVERDDEKALNRSVFISTDGEVKGMYSKIHPFSYASENEFFNSGNSLQILDMHKFKIGLTICYDLRFPELYQALSKNCSLIINIANWPEKRVDHWNSLLKARAIENQVFMIGVNRIGVDGNDISYVKSSQIVDPEGQLLGQFLSSEEYDLYDINPDFVNEVRSRFPMKNDRKVELYRNIL